jgi:hypothetical protein
VADKGDIEEIKNRLDALETTKKKKAPKKAALIHMVLDRSGSMDAIWDGVKEGFDGFIATQREFDADVSLTFFDDQHGKAFTNLPVKSVKKLRNYKEIHPRGSTALLDAVGSGIKDVERVAKQYSKIVFVVYTDGLENASKDWTGAQVRELIRKHRDKWQFVYLGANQDAWAVGTGLGFHAYSTRTYDHTYAGASSSMGATGQSVGSYLRGDTDTVDMTEDDSSKTPVPQPN